MLNKILVLFIFLVMPLASWSQTKYVVQAGDTILKVADRTLGSADRKDPRRYALAKKIKKMNPGLKDPNVLEPGQVLILPGPIAKETAPPKEAKVVSEPLPLPKSEPAEEESEPAEQKAVTASPPLPAPENAHHMLAQPEPPKEAPKVEARVYEAPKAKPISHESEHSSFFFIQPRYQQLKLTAIDRSTDAKVSMTSKSSAGLDIQYGLALNDQYHLLLQAGVTRTDFDKIEGDNATTEHTSETLKSFGIGIGYEATSKLHMDFMFVAAEHSFILPETLPVYELKAVMSPGAELNISYDLYSGSSNIFGISAIGEFIATTAKDSIEYQSTVEGIGALYWKTNLGADRVNYKATVTYKQGHQDTSVTKQQEDVTSLGIGFYF